MRKEIIKASGKIRCDKCPNGSELNCKAMDICTFAFYKGYESGERAVRKKIKNNQLNHKKK